MLIIIIIIIRESRSLTCLHHQSEAEAGPHLRPLPAQGRLCRHPAAGRGVPPVGHRLKTESTTPQRTIYIIHNTDVFTLGVKCIIIFIENIHRLYLLVCFRKADYIKMYSNINRPPLFIKKVLKALCSWAFSNIFRSLSGGSLSHRLLCLPSFCPADTPGRTELHLICSDTTSNLSKLIRE